MQFSIEETKWAGKAGYHYEVLDSTNKKAKELAEAGAPHGTLVTADEQLAGVGRRGRSWSSEPGQGIYMSLVLRPDIATDKASMLTLVSAMAVSKAIYEMIKDCNVYPFIKWPNDIYVGDKKICGMLIENFLSGDKLSESIIGIGLNINQKLFSKDIPNPTSLILETSSEEKYDVKKELEIFVEIFSQQYAQIISADLEQLKANARYCQLLYRMGEEHRYLQTDYYTEGTPGEIVGKIVGIEEKTARLILQLDNGQLRKYFFKEIAYII